MTADDLALIVKGLAPVIRGYVDRQLATARTEVEASLARAESGLVMRVAALESAPAARDGRDGRDGADGAPGVDGLGYGDLEVVHDGERRFTVRAVDGDRVKDLGTFTIPCEIYRGVWTAAAVYERGDCVTHGGSEWHCNTTATAKPGDGSAAWTLKVKRGRDGRDAPALAMVGAR